MEFNLTRKHQYSHHDKDGKDRNYALYFLNDVLILKQKLPFDTNWEKGFDRRTCIYDIYLLNGRLHQKRCKTYGCGHPDNEETTVRTTSFPILKKVLSQFNIPKDFKISEI